MITPGTYNAIITEIALCQAEKGTEYIGVEFEIADGPCTGEKITTKLYWTDAARERTEKTLGNLGWGGQLDQDCNLIGLSGTYPIGVREKEYPAGSGKKTMDVSWIVVQPTGLYKRDRLTLSQAKGFAQQVKASVGVANGKPTGKAPANRGDAYEGTDTNY